MEISLVSGSWVSADSTAHRYTEQPFFNILKARVAKITRMICLGLASLYSNFRPLGDQGKKFLLTVYGSLMPS